MSAVRRAVTRRRPDHITYTEVQVAQQILSNNESQHLVDPAILDDLAAEVVISRFPGIEDRPRAFSGFTSATAVLITPALESLAQAYRQACRTPSGRDAAHLFISRILEVEA
jgi:hypothetical protein